MTEEAGRGFTDLVLEKYGVAPGETFNVVLPDGEKMTFRALGRYSEVCEFNARAARWCESLPKPGTPEAQAHIWAEHLPETDKEAVAAYTLAELSVEPKLSQLDALRWLRAPWLIKHMMTQIEKGSRSVLGRLEALALEQAKNASGAMSGTDTSSPSPETSGDATTEN